MLLTKQYLPWEGDLLKRWLALPLKNIDSIKKRHELVKFFIDSDAFSQTVSYQLQQISDLERLISKVATAKGISKRNCLAKRLFKSHSTH